MKFFTRKAPKDLESYDILTLRLLRQQIAATETQKILGQITDQEYQETLKRCHAELQELEARHGLSDQQ